MFEVIMRRHNAFIALRAPFCVMIPALKM